MSCEYDFVEGDTGSILRITCKDKSDQVIDLSGADVVLKWNDSTGVLQEKNMTINSPATAGIIQYSFSAGELYPPSMLFSVRITDSSGGIVHSNCVIKTLVREALT